MIKTILVPATGSDMDLSVFSSALAIARRFGAHLNFLHVGIDPVTIGAIITSEASSTKLVSDLIKRVEEEADQCEQKARQQFESFCQGEGLVITATLPSPSAPSAEWLREGGSEAYWLAEYGRASDLLVIGRPGEGETI